MKLLLHTCCAPCSVYCIERLREEAIEPTVYWYNPNIHPYTEYKARRDTLKEYTTSIGVEAIFEENYGLQEFTKQVIEDLPNRCANYCYLVRLEKTAKYAKEHGYDAFSTTLLISPYQNHELLKELGEKIAKKYGIVFVYRDFREGFREGQQKARQLGLYMQKYCGCVFSEEERYAKQITQDKENNVNKIQNYRCKIASIEEIKTKWEYEIKSHPNDNKWVIWKENCIKGVQAGTRLCYYGILDDEIITEATVILAKEDAQNSDGLIDEQTAYLTGFRTIKKFQGKGYFSILYHFLEKDLEKKGYTRLTLGVEPCEVKNMKIYLKWGYDNFVKTAYIEYPPKNEKMEPEKIIVNYYAKNL